jgi:hypothetical protein
MIILLLTNLVLQNCAPKVWVEPRTDLNQYGTLGMTKFSSNAQGNLSEFASRKFIETLQFTQSGIKILELGSTQQVLAEINSDQWDFQAVKDVGEFYGIESVFVGDMNVGKIKPKIGLLIIPSMIDIKAEVEATLTIRLLDTNSGATLWMGLAQASEIVAGIIIMGGGPYPFNAQDENKAYGRLVNKLLQLVTDDFRAHQVRKRS